MEGLASLHPVPPGSRCYYCDLSYLPIKVCAVQQGGRVLQLWDATCEAAQFVVAAVVGGSRVWTVGEWVALLNVRVRRNMQLEIGEGTLVVSLPSLTLPLSPSPPLPVDEAAASLAAPPPPQAKQSEWPWTCYFCWHVNYPRQALCWKCEWPKKRARKKARNRGQAMPTLGAE